MDVSRWLYSGRVCMSNYTEGLIVYVWIEAECWTAEGEER